jgi:pyruvate, water dikinase
MANWLRFLKKKFARASGGFPDRERLAVHFRFKYSCFKELLVSNKEFLDILSDLEDKLLGHQVFGMSYISSKATRAVFHALRMVKNLDDLSNHHYPQLFKIVENIYDRIKAIISSRKELPPGQFILPYGQINAEMVDWVGGKNAHLGEMKSRLDLPIPDGFAITTQAFQAFLGQNDLFDEINRRKMEIDPSQPETIMPACEEIQRAVLTAPLPPDLEEALVQAFDEMARRLSKSLPDGAPLQVALRSSAIGEDSELSFAGQYLSILNVGREKLVQSYKMVIASLYTPRAISYRLNKGIRDEDIAMSVACLQLIDSVASGIMYSRHPFKPRDEDILINAVWGLGPYAVDGVITPDTYRVAKQDRFNILSLSISTKEVQLVRNPRGGLTELPVEEEKKHSPCLSPEQISTLADYARRLEEHYHIPQDSEWALDPQGRIFLLQSRPLQIQVPERSGTPDLPGLDRYPVLLEEGTSASPGVGCGPVFLIRNEDDLKNFPEGAVLVAKHSSPKFVIVMKKAGAIVTDTGSITGHMASLAREFNVPAILGARGATALLRNGQEITVDAYEGRIYAGKVPELLSRQQKKDSRIKETPVYQILRQAADWIVPLNLVDPKSPDFSPEGCRTLHDVCRLVHELSYREMFLLGDLVSGREGVAFKLDASIPLDLHVIDLEGGFSETPAGTKISLDQIASVPFKALLRGMTLEDFKTPQVRPVEFKGFMSVMSEQLLTNPQASDRFGDRSFAIISDKYLNFSSRVGYHYSVLDAYCGQTINKNYITFSFKGGAADEVRRNRRVRSIAHILRELDFTVEVQGDRVDARFQKYEGPVIEEKLDQLGRLLIYTRQMDMLMNSEASVEGVSKNFLAGNYRYE